MRQVIKTALAVSVLAGLAGCGAFAKDFGDQAGFGPDRRRIERKTGHLLIVHGRSPFVHFGVQGLLKTCWRHPR